VIRRGDIVTFKPQWRDPGDEDCTFVAVDDEANGRVTVVHADSRLTIKPTQIVATYMVDRGRSGEARDCAMPQSVHSITSREEQRQ
jgi:hypothetical protein